MDSKTVLPLPPGMVPSDSREDLRDLNFDEVNKEDTLLPNASLGGSRSDKENVSVVGPTTSEIPGKTINAWEGPKNEIQGSQGEPFKNRDLEEIENKMMRTKMDISPFISNPSATGQKTKPTALTSDQVAPKRIMSPIKRLNRVVPFESNSSQAKPLKLEATQEASKEIFEPSDTSIIDHKLGSSFAEQVLGKVYPMSSTPTDKKSEQPESSEVYLEPVVVIKKKTLAKEDTAPTYSTVLKKKDREKAKDVKSTPITAAPGGLNVYEPDPSLDTSIIIGNKAATPEPLQVSDVTENEYTNNPDPVYSTIEDVEEEMAPEQDMTDMPLAPYNSALIKQLKKHDSNKGNVKLLSMKGKVGAVSSPEMFPKGTSVDMLAFHYAAANGDTKTLARIISNLPVSQDTIERVMGTEKMVKREEIDVEDSEGRTPLMHAVHNNQLEAVKMLVESGANVNRPASDGSTALHQVAFTGHIEMIALLLSLGGDGTIRDNEGRTPLHWATNNPSAKGIELFLDKLTELDVNVRDGALMTPLMWAAFHCRPEHVRTLLDRGADPSLRDIDGMAAIHWSIQKHDTRVLQILINSKSVLYTDNKGKTIMHQAAEQGSASSVSMVKAVKPTSLDALDINGRTPLHWATACENPEVIRALLHHGADSRIADLSGKTALDYATEKGKHYCALLLTKAEVLGSTDSYHSILNYGSTSAMPGSRAINSQEGQLLNIDEIKASLTSEQTLQIQAVCTGLWMNKFTNEGQGPLHPRYFWVNPSNTKLCWSQTKGSSSRNIKSDTLVGTRSSASPVVFGRKDFDPLDKHKYAFTIFTSNRIISVVALSSEDYKTWINGLQLVIHLGGMTVTRLISTLKTGSRGPPVLIP